MMLGFICRVMEVMVLAVMMFGAALQTTQSAEVNRAVQPHEQNVVMCALEKFKVLNGVPKADADYYIYLYTATWCGYCHQCMPIAVEQYENMREAKVEIIIVSGDKSEDEALKYLGSYSITAPCIMFDALKATNFQGLPSCGMPGFPGVTVVDKNGRMRCNVIGAGQVKDVLQNWRQYTVGK